MKTVLRILTFCWVLLFFVACGANASAANAPTPVKVAMAKPGLPLGLEMPPPTYVPTWSPAVFAPTATPTTGQNRDAAEILRAALAKNGELSSYRVQYLWASDMNGNLQELLRNSWEFKDKDFHGSLWVFGETIVVGDRAFQKNTLTDHSWAPAPNFKIEEVRSDLGAGSVFESYVGDPVKWAFEGTETLDGIECDVLVQDKYAAGEISLKMLGYQKITRANIDASVEEAEGKAWVCRDGYLHQITLNVVQKGIYFAWLVSVYDINADIRISLPVPSSEAPEGDATARVRDAIKQTMGLKSYRFETEIFGDTLTAGRVKGKVQSNDEQYTRTTPDGTTNEEMLVIGGQMYRRDPDSGTAWETLPEAERSQLVQLQAPFTDLVDDSPTATHYNGRDTPFTWKEKETLDGLSCDAYVQTQKPDGGAYYEMTVCPDGYWHRGQATITFEATPPSDKMLSMTVTTRLFDHNLPNAMRAPVPEEMASRIWETYDPFASYLFYGKSDATGLGSVDYLGRTDGTEEWRVAPENTGAVRVSPAGKHLGYDKDCGDLEAPDSCIYISKMDGSDEHMVVRGKIRNWSPDGCRILGRNELDNDRNEYFVVNADGTNQQVIGTVASAQWMPDSEGVAYVVDGKLYVYELDSGETPMIPMPGDVSDFPDPEISPDGTQVAIVSHETSSTGKEHSVVHIVELESGKHKRIEASYDIDGAWSPDSNRFVYTTSESDGDTETETLFILDLDGESRYVGKWNTSVFVRGWSPDGSMLLFELIGGGAVPRTVIGIKPDETLQVVFAFEGALARWSPDGTQIAYESENGPIAVMNADGTGARELYEGYRPEWVPPVRDTKCEP